MHWHAVIDMFFNHVLLTDWNVDFSGKQLFVMLLMMLLYILCNVFVDVTFVDILKIEIIINL